MVKVTGGQRLDIFGIKKEDLPAVWADLNAAGMVSGHAYGKAPRTVKTCVGSEWCRFGRSEERRVGKSVSVRVDLGGRRIIKKKQNQTNTRQWNSSREK